MGSAASVHSAFDCGNRPELSGPGSRQVYPFTGKRTHTMHRYARTLLYGILVFVVYSGISFALSGRVNWTLAAATAAGVMIADFFVVSRRRR